MRSMFCLVAVTVSCTANLTGENTPNGSADLPRKLEMHQRFVALGAIQDAIVDGDLAMAKTYAVAIQAGDFSRAPFQWLPHIDDFKTGAIDVEGSGSLGQAAQGAVNMATACGECHRSNDAGVTFADGGDPPEDQPMLQHAWAVDRMWEGLVAPSDNLWLVGAKSLTGADLETRGLKDETSRSVVKRLASEVRSQGRRASRQVGDARAETMARILETCAQCHSLVR
ncbi:MAG: hypothetical protein AAFP04_02385 [Myxococcota bacterium]